MISNMENHVKYFMQKKTITKTFDLSSFRIEIQYEKDRIKPDLS